MPTSPPSPTDTARELASGILITAKTHFESLVLGDDRVPERSLAAFRSVMDVADELVATCVRIGGPSTPDRRATEVLSASIGADRAAAQRALKILHTLHGPQTKPKAEVCGLPVTVWDLDRCIRPDGHTEPHLAVREDGLALSRAHDASPLTEPEPPLGQQAPA